MKKPLSQAEVEKRFAEINALPAEEPTKEDIAAIEAAKLEMDDATSLEDYKASLEGYSGKLVIRIPRSLHRELKQAAALEDVSLNQYILYKLAK